MKIGIISDIHADRASLERALSLLRRAGVDKVVCAGDLVEKGDEGDEVIALIAQHCIPCVKGNHDDNAVRHAALSTHQEETSRERARRRKENPLSAASIDYLEALPQTRSYIWEGQRLMLAHATPFHLSASIFSSSFHRHGTAPEGFSKAFKKFLTRSHIDLLILGHTHTPMVATFRDICIVNPGSICHTRSRDSHTFATLSLPDYTFEVYDLHTGDPTEHWELHFPPESA